MTDSQATYLMIAMVMIGVMLSGLSLMHGITLSKLLTAPQCVLQKSTDWDITPPPFSPPRPHQPMRDA